MPTNERKLSQHTARPAIFEDCPLESHAERAHYSREEALAALTKLETWYDQMGNWYDEQEQERHDRQMAGIAKSKESGRAKFGRPKAKISEKKLQAAYLQYRNGKSLSQCAYECRVSTPTMRKAFKEHEEYLNKNMTQADRNALTILEAQKIAKK